MDWSITYLEKSCCSVLNKETPWEKIIVNLPAGEYGQYHIEHSGRNGSIDTNYAWLRYPNDYTFQLITTVREPGKKYKRPKLTVSEFEAIFKEMNDKMQRRNNLWLAEIMEYDYNKYGVEESRIQRYAVGSLDDSWFYLNKDEKKRISSKTFKLVKPMSDVDVQDFNQFNSTLKELKSEIFKISDYIDKIKYAWNQYREPGEKIKEAHESLLELCGQEIESCKQQIKSLDDSFIDSIKAYVTEMPVEIQGQVEKVNTKKERVVVFKEIEPLQIIKDSEKAVQVHKPGVFDMWLPKKWVKLSEDNKSVVAVNKQALRKISA